MTIRLWLWVLAAAALIAFVAGAAIGVRYADGRCAAEKLEASDAARREAVATLESSREKIEQQAAANAEAAKAEAKAASRQQTERVRYVEKIRTVEIPGNCRLPDDAHGMLVDAIRAANLAAAAD